jgi:lipid-binding SYLF domain-containing protein
MTLRRLSPPEVCVQEGYVMSRYLTLSLTLCLALGSTVVSAENNKEQERLENAGVVMQEVLDVPDNIPQELLEKAECVIVIPSMTKIALGVGGSYGRGAMVCRSGKTFSGPWGAPAMYALDGGSFGLQLGAESTDVILLVMNNRGLDALLGSKVKLGANLSAAAGPKGRNAEASTDATLRAEILSYSRSRGLFAGVSLEGTSLRPDDDANRQVYGRKITARAIVQGAGVKVPASGVRLVSVLEKNAPRNESKKASR